MQGVRGRQRDHSHRDSSGRPWRGVVVWASPLLVLSLVILSGLAGSRWFLNHGPLPEFVREQIQSTLAKGFGPDYTVTVGAVSFFNPVRVGVNQIRVVPAGATDPPLLATQVEMTLRWQSLIQRLLGNRRAPLPVTGLSIQRLRVDSAELKGAGSAGLGAGGVESWLDGGNDPASRDPEAALSKWTNRSVTVLVNRVGRLLGLNAPSPTQAAASTPTGATPAQLASTRSPASASAVSGGSAGDPTSLPHGLATATAVADRLAIPSTKDFSISIGTLELTRTGQLRSRLTGLMLARDGDRLELGGQLQLPAYPVTVKASVQWLATDRPQVSVTAQLASPMTIMVAGQPLAIRDGLLTGVWQGDSFQVNQWRLASEQALLVGDGQIEPSAGGTSSAVGQNDGASAAVQASWRNPYLRLQVRQGRLRLPDALPFLAAYGVRGQAQVNGTLVGPWRDPTFSGHLATAAAQLFGEPVRQVDGSVKIDRRQVKFIDTKVVGGRDVAGQPTEYQVGGTIRYTGVRAGTSPDTPRSAQTVGVMNASAKATGAAGTGASAKDQTPAAPGLDLTVRTQRGLLEEWLPAFLPSWDVHGEVSGVLTVKGPAGQVAVAGSLLVRRGVWRQVHFDEAQVAFRWEDGSLTLERSTARAGGSQLTMNGRWDGSADQMHFQIRGDGLPLSVGQARESFLRLPVLPRAQAASPASSQLSTAVAGQFGLAGTLSGSPSQPRFVGTVASDGFTLANWQFDQANGRVQWDGAAIWVDGLFAHRQGGGTYTLSGRVDGVQWPSSAPPQLDLSLQVDGEPASQLLSLAKMDLPLVDGTVYGRGKVRGTLDNPRLVANLALQNGHFLGRAVDVGMDVVLEDHKVNVKQLHFSGSAWSVENGQQHSPGGAS